MHVCSYVRTSSKGWPTNGSISTCARFVNRQEFIGESIADFGGFLHAGCPPLNKSRCFNVPLSPSCHASTVRPRNTRTGTFSYGFIFPPFTLRFPLWPSSLSNRNPLCSQRSRVQAAASVIVTSVYAARNELLTPWLPLPPMATREMLLTVITAKPAYVGRK